MGLFATDLHGRRQSARTHQLHLLHPLQPHAWGSSSHSPARGKHDSSSRCNPWASLHFLFSLWNMMGYECASQAKVEILLKHQHLCKCQVGIGVFLIDSPATGRAKHHPTWSLIRALSKWITVANGYRSLHTLTRNQWKQSAWNFGQYWPGYLEYQNAAMSAQELSDTATFFGFYLSLVVTRAFRAETGKISNCGKQWENKRPRAPPTHIHDSDMGLK